MKFSVDKQEKYVVFQLLESFLNSLIAPQLKTEFVLLRNEKVENLILDLSDVEYIDSSGLSAILTAHRLWKEDGLFIITGVNHPMIKKLFEISKIDSISVIIPTLEESIEYIFMDQLEKDLNED
jgi:anti-sigma B factor antagonist